MISISRVSRAGDQAIVKSSAGYKLISKTSPEIIEGDFKSLTASGSWRRSTDKDTETFAELLEIVDGGIVASAPVKEQKERTFRAPKSVREEINAALKEFSALISDHDRDIAKRIASGPITKADVEWMHTFFNQIEKAEKLRGGKRGATWAAKMLATDESLTASVSPLSDDVFYYGIGDNPNTTVVQALLAVDPVSNLVLEWSNGEFTEVVGENLSDIDEPYVIPLDGETAAKVAEWINLQPADNIMGYDVYSHDVVERNLWELAAPELDLNELDQLGSLIADATGYSPIERSVNAKRQTRGPGGKFGGSGGANPPGEKLYSMAKAKLPMALPLVENPGQRIQEWLEEAAVVASLVVEMHGLVAAAESETAEETVEETSTEETAAALYFAIVDEVDNEAVMDVVAIRRKEGQPEAWVRKNGEWVNGADILSDLTDSTPPPVVELSDVETVKTVIAQVDEHDNAPKKEDIEESTSEDIQRMSEASVYELPGFALADGSLKITDTLSLEGAVAMLSMKEPAQHEIAHVRKRAKALNRIDLIPSEWREISLAEKGEQLNSSKLFGEFGEIITAAGVPGIADTPSDFAAAARLRNYWTRGKGALKIRWGTKGDLTRAHRHLSKYVGPIRAWGLAQSWHKHLFGVSNTTRDKAVGHYKPRRRKKR